MNDAGFEEQLCDALRRGALSQEGLQRLVDMQYLFFLEEQVISSILAHGRQIAAEEQRDVSQNIHTEEGSKEKISVIIPTKNRAELLCRCIDSILMQQYESIELLIVDDCSSDHTAQTIFERYSHNSQIIYMRSEKPLGPGRSRQLGFQHCTGKYVVFMDDDDFYVEPAFFRKAADVLSHDPEVSMVCANSLVCDEQQKSISFCPLTVYGKLSGEAFFWGFSSMYQKPNSTFPTMLRKETLDRAGFYDMQMMNDTSIYLRTLCFGNAYMMPEWVGIYWVHASNISKNLPHRFIIENLAEKKNIYRLAKKRFGQSADEWYSDQLAITIQYYLCSRNLGIAKLLSVLWWVLRNGASTRWLLLRKSVKYYMESNANDN